MALNTWYYVNGVRDGTIPIDGGFRWKIINSEEDRVANNRSLVRIEMFGIRTTENGTVWNGYDNTSYIEVGGTRYNQTTRYDFRNATVGTYYFVGVDTTVFAKGSALEVYVPHNEDGTKTVTIKTFFNGANSPYLNNITTTSNVTLDTINRGVIRIKVAGVWKTGKVYTKVAGVWKQATSVSTKISGTWKRSI